MEVEYMTKEEEAPIKAAFNDWWCDAFGGEFQSNRMYGAFMAGWQARSEQEGK